MSGMMDKLKEAQQKVERTKTRLNTVLIDEISANGQLKISLTENREIKSISINNSLLSDAEELEDHLIVTLNKAIEKATKINEVEMAAAAAKSGMPNISGMDFFK